MSVWIVHSGAQGSAVLIDNWLQLQLSWLQPIVNEAVIVLAERREVSLLDAGGELGGKSSVRKAENLFMCSKSIS